MDGGKALDILTICNYTEGMIMELLGHKDYMRVLVAVEHRPRRFNQLQKALGLNPVQIHRALSFLRKGLYVVPRTLPTNGERIVVEYRLGKRGAAFLESYKSFGNAAVKRKGALGLSAVAEIQSIYR
jgi:DNA-binding HxlR family transcriptional regulator